MATQRLLDEKTSTIKQLQTELESLKISLQTQLKSQLGLVMKTKDEEFTQMDDKISAVKEMIERQQFEKDLRAKWMVEQEEKQIEIFKTMKEEVDRMLESYKDEMSSQIKILKSEAKVERDKLEEELKLKTGQIERDQQRMKEF